MRADLPHSRTYSMSYLSLEELARNHFTLYPQQYLVVGGYEGRIIHYDDEEGARISSVTLEGARTSHSRSCT
jgi:hypothetical protein